MVRKSTFLSERDTEIPAPHPAQAGVMHGLGGHDAKRPIGQQDPLRLSVVKIWCFAPGDSQACNAGSGLFIAPDVILTVGHVVFDPGEYGAARSNGYVGHVQIESPWFSIPVQAASTERVVAPPGWTARPPQLGLDIGIIKLNAPVPGATPLLAHPASDPELTNAPVAVYGVPTIGQQLYVGSGSIVTATNDLLYYTADAAEGESGGAVMAVLSGIPELVALHRAGPGATPANIPTSVSGVRLTPAVIGWVQAMIPSL